MRDVAAAAAACLTETGHAGNTYRLSGPDILTSHELAETLADVLGRPVVAQTPPTELAIQGMRNAGLPEWAIDHFPSLLAHNRTRMLAKVTSTVRDITGKEPTTWRQFVHDALA